MAYKLTEAERKHVSTVEDTSFYLVKEEQEGTTQKLTIHLEDKTEGGLNMAVELPTSHFEIDKADDEKSRIRLVDSDGKEIICEGAVGNSGNPLGLGWRYKVCFTFDEVDGVKYINNMKVIRRNDGREWDHPIQAFSDLRIKSINVDNDSKFEKALVVAGKFTSETEAEFEAVVVNDLTVNGSATFNGESKFNEGLKSSWIIATSNIKAGKAIKAKNAEIAEKVTTAGVETVNLNVTDTSTINNANVTKLESNVSSLGIADAATLAVENDVTVGGNVSGTNATFDKVISRGEVQCQDVVADGTVQAHSVVTSAVIANRGDIKTVQSDNVFAKKVEASEKVAAPLGEITEVKSTSVTANSVESDNLKTGSAVVDTMLSVTDVAANTVTAQEIDGEEITASGSVKTNNLKDTSGIAYAQVSDDEVKIGSPAKELVLVTTQDASVNDENFGHMKATINGVEKYLANKEDIDALNPKGLVDRYTNQTINGVKKFTNSVMAQAGVGYLDEDNEALNLVGRDRIMQLNPEYEGAAAQYDAYMAAMESYSDIYALHSKAYSYFTKINANNSIISDKNTAISDYNDEIVDIQAAIDALKIWTDVELTAKKAEVDAAADTVGANAGTNQQNLLEAETELNKAKYYRDLSTFVDKIHTQVALPENNIHASIQSTVEGIIDNEYADHNITDPTHVNIASYKGLMDCFYSKIAFLVNFGTFLGITNAGVATIANLREEAKGYSEEITSEKLDEYNTVIANYNAALANISPVEGTAESTAALIEQLEADHEAATAAYNKSEVLITDLSDAAQNVQNAYHDLVAKMSVSGGSFTLTKGSNGTTEYYKLTKNGVSTYFLASAYNESMSAAEILAIPNAGIDNTVVFDATTERRYLLSVEAVAANTALTEAEVAYNNIIDANPEAGLTKINFTFETVVDDVTTGLEANNATAAAYKTSCEANVASLDSSIAAAQAYATYLALLDEYSGMLDENTQNISLKAQYNESIAGKRAEILALEADVNNLQQKNEYLNSCFEPAQEVYVSTVENTYKPLLNTYNQAVIDHSADMPKPSIVTTWDESLVDADNNPYIGIASPDATSEVLSFKNGEYPQYIVKEYAPYIDVGNDEDQLRFISKGTANGDEIDEHIVATINGKYHQLANLDDILTNDTDIKNTEDGVQIDQLSRATDSEGIPVANKFAAINSGDGISVTADDEKNITVALNDEAKEILEAAGDAIDAKELAEALQDRAFTSDDETIVIEQNGFDVNFSANLINKNKAYTPEDVAELYDFQVSENEGPFNKTASAVDLKVLNDKTNANLKELERKFNIKLPDAPATATTGRYNLVANVANGAGGLSATYVWQDCMTTALPNSSVEGGVDANGNPLDGTKEYGLKLHFELQDGRYVPVISWAELV